MARRFHRAGAVRSQRRETVWIGLSPLVDTASAASVLVSSLSATALALRPFTIVRTHIELMFDTDQAAASENQLGAIGLAVINAPAVVIGITAMPTPVTDLGSDLFFVHQAMVSHFEFGDLTGFNSQAGRRYTVDSKAMRKVNDDEDIAFTYEVSGGGGGANLLSMGRMLLKLH